MAEVSRWYPSKVDGWLAAMLCVPPVVTLASFIWAMAAGEGLWATIIPVLLVAAVYVGILLPMRYGISDDAIVVRHGLVRQRIPLAAIVEVAPTRSALSSPALSLDRLRIRFGTGFFKNAMISPADKAGFLAELAARTGLSREGDRLVRPGGAASAPQAVATT